MPDTRARRRETERHRWEAGASGSRSQNRDAFCLFSGRTTRHHEGTRARTRPAECGGCKGPARRTGTSPPVSIAHTEKSTRWSQ